MRIDLIIIIKKSLNDKNSKEKKGLRVELGQAIKSEKEVVLRS